MVILDISKVLVTKYSSSHSNGLSDVLYTIYFFQVVTDILHLQGKQLSTYKGNYDTFERSRAEQLKNKQKAFESNERSRAHMQVLVHIDF